MPRYEIRRREEPEVFKRRLFVFCLRVKLKRPWGLYRDGLLIGAYKTRPEAEEILAELPDNYERC